jgi:hypothetical protein
MVAGESIFVEYIDLGDVASDGKSLIDLASLRLFRDRFLLILGAYTTSGPTWEVTDRRLLSSSCSELTNFSSSVSDAQQLKRS